MKKMSYRLCFLFLPLLMIYKVQGSILIPSLSKDRESIKQLKGCYEVTFQNAETFALQKPYTFRDRYQSKALEWISLDEDQERFISLQHLLLIPGGVIKHWRQTWSYENDVLWDFVAPLTWQKRELNEGQTKQRWTQKVYQVDDSPRYECSAPWIHYGDQHFWECETDAPLPRREFTTRQDYQILHRKNRHQLTSTGHLHDEQNTKMIQNQENPQQRTALVMEQGMNIYKKVEEGRCEEAKKWWNDHRRFWKDIQFVWSQIYSEKEQLAFYEKRNGKLLWEQLFEMDQQYSQQADYSSGKIQRMGTELIRTYLETK